MLTRPAHQGIAAQGHPRRHQADAAGLAVCAAQPAQDPVDFLVVSRVVSARRVVVLPAATAEMRDHAMHIVLRRPVGEGLRIVALR